MRAWDPLGVEGEPLSTDANWLPITGQPKQRWRTLKWFRRRRRALAVASAGLLALAAAWFTVGRNTIGTRLVAYIDGSVTTNFGRIGTVYNVGIPVWVNGPGTVRIVTARARHLGDGMTQLEPLVGYNCGGKGWILGDVGDVARTSKYDIRQPEDASLRASKRDPCWYLVLRFVPQKAGHITARDGLVVYRVGGITRHTRFTFGTAVNVVGTGKDFRDTY